MASTTPPATSAPELPPSTVSTTTTTSAANSGGSTTVRQSTTDPAPTTSAFQFGERFVAADGQRVGRDVVGVLSDAGVCVYCALRFLGERTYTLYLLGHQTLIATLRNVCENQALFSAAHPICPTCFGVLTKCHETTFVDDVLVRPLLAGGWKFNGWSLTVTLPVSLVVRDYSMWHHLRSRFGDSMFGKLAEETVVSIKEAFKWVTGPVVGSKINQSFTYKANFHINVQILHAATISESQFLQQNQRRRKFACQTTTPEASIHTATSALQGLTRDQFIKHCACPPAKVDTEFTCQVTFSHDSIYLGGRYCKYSPNLSQSPWFIDGQRHGDYSIEELIYQAIGPFFEGSGYKFSASGREDMDVRMLGNGRPFVLEIVNPKKPHHTDEEYGEIQKRMNTSTDKVQISHLQRVSQENLSLLKAGEENKRKAYRALVWCSKEVTAEMLAPIRAIKDLTLAQKTPLRVLHRRTLSTRMKVVHSADFEVLDTPHFFVLHVTTQAGTYIKEFVHGDLGRTTPNIGSMLGCDTDILQLDVMGVELDFPPPIRPAPLLPYAFKIPERICVRDFKSHDQDMGEDV
ncbi:trna pseudouridine synthase pus10 [Pelomyxa schiedti]|nr:trna pseudouridine synthase pus10 [Pelomyxa schiedti]